LKRLEAISVLKELIVKCEMCDGNWVALMPPDSHNISASGFQIHLKFPSNPIVISCVEKILKKYGLSMVDKKEHELLIIYRPKK